ncbi:unnamed protein product [Aspergillus oryzae]|uniref:Unnamed protein product n=2 Tax=Aspergillus oryzae TaxID=5062 RepID=A0AAN4YF74_ASPOZ|nr:unnamed protein product [Aspergillus oryzae]GMF88040.1 unnamed protein product [Aspergillus oryzae]GMG24386.1 unnamed protein product [Aspergillus oryzae]GMG47658.1 unnamed protein product [Aspergillus oryzae var. brunneus]
MRSDMTRLAAHMSSKSPPSDGQPEPCHQPVVDLAGPEDPTDAMGAVTFADEEECGNQQEISSPRMDKIAYDGGFVSATRPPSPVSGRTPTAVHAGLATDPLLPSSEETLQLIRRYFYDTGLLFPYIHPPTFFETYHQFKNNAKKVRRTWLGLLNIMLAMAKVTAVSTHAPAETRITESTRYYRQALNLCRGEILRGTTLEVGGLAHIVYLLSAAARLTFPLSVGETMGRVLSIENQLLSWVMALPNNLRQLSLQDLREEVGQSDSQPRLFPLKFRVILTLRYLHIQILLHRPILVKFLDASHASGLEPGEERVLNEIGYSSMKKCVESAMGIIDMIHELVCATGWQRDLLGAWWYSLYYSKLPSLAFLWICEYLITLSPGIAFNAALVIIGATWVQRTRQSVRDFPSHQLANIELYPGRAVATLRQLDMAENSTDTAPIDLGLAAMGSSTTDGNFPSFGIECGEFMLDDLFINITQGPALERCGQCHAALEELVTSCQSLVKGASCQIAVPYFGVVTVNRKCDDGVVREDETWEDNPTGLDMSEPVTTDAEQYNLPISFDDLLFSYVGPWMVPHPMYPDLAVDQVDARLNWVLELHCSEGCQIPGFKDRRIIVQLPIASDSRPWRAKSSCLGVTDGAHPEPSSSRRLSSPCLLVFFHWRCSSDGGKYPNSSSPETFLYGFVVPILSFMLESRLNMDPSKTQRMTTAVLTVHGFVSLIFAPVIAHFADKTPNRKAPLLIALAGCVAVEALFVGRILQAVAGSATWIIGFATLTDNVDLDHMGKAMGTAMAFVTAGQLSGPIVAGALLEWVGYWPTWSAPLLVLCLDIIARRLMIERRELPLDDRPRSPKLAAPHDPEESERAPLLPSTPTNESPDYNAVPTEAEQVGPSRSFYRIMIGDIGVVASVANTLIFATLISAFDATLPLHLRDTFHWNTLSVGMIFLSLQVPSMCLGPLVGWLRDRAGARWPVTIGWALSAPLLWLLGVPGEKMFPWASPETNGEAIFITGLVTIGIVFTLIRGAGTMQLVGESPWRSFPFSPLFNSNKICAMHRVLLPQRNVIFRFLFCIGFLDIEVQITISPVPNVQHKRSESQSQPAKPMHKQTSYCMITTPPPSQQPSHHHPTLDENITLQKPN